MRETITFPRPYHRPLTSVLLVAFLGALMLVLALPVSIHAGWKASEVAIPAGRAAAQVTIPAGTTLSVETLAELSTRMRVGTTFETRLTNGLLVGGQLVTPAGTAVYGIVTRAEGGSRSRTQRLATTLTGIRWKGQVVPLSGDTAGVEVRPGNRGPRHITLPAGKELDVHLLLPVRLP